MLVVFFPQSLHSKAFHQSIKLWDIRLRRNNNQKFFFKNIKLCVMQLCSASPGKTFYYTRQEALKQFQGEGSTQETHQQHKNLPVTKYNKRSCILPFALMHSKSLVTDY